MILKDITLVNIGAYRGFNDFDLSTTEENPVVVIGGENGAGKTTFLNAIKLGIFGSYSLGYKTESAEYFKHVKSLLNHEAVRIHENNFAININFSLVEGFKTVEYNLKRRWNLTTDGKVKEIVYLTGNNSLYNDEQVQVFMDKLKENMPPQILDLCLFDGEEISKIISEDRLSNYIEKVAKVAFNLELFETLELDLEKYSKQSLDTSTLQKNEKELLTLKEEIAHKRHSLQKAKTALFNAETHYRNLSDEHTETRKTFKNFGGLMKTEYENILKEISAVELERQKIQEEVKRFVSSTLPFYLVPHLLTTTRDQIQSENDAVLYNKLNDVLTVDKMDNLANQFNIDDADLLKSQILKMMQSNNITEPIHFASFSESSLVENVHQQVSANDELTVKIQMLEKSRELGQQLRALRDKLKVHERNTEFNEMLSKLETLASDIQNAEQLANSLRQQVSELTKEIEKLMEQEQALHHAIRNLDKVQSSFLQSQTIIELSKKFRLIQLNKKLLHVQNEATKMLQRIFRKENYVTSIQIDPKTYEVTLKDASENPIEKRTLSAGEKQILLISIIWAIFTTSNKQLPFIFDTLLGRLDKTHKAAVLTEFIPQSGSQAIILSTDSEIDEEHFELLSPFVSHAYRLEFDTNTQQTSINNGYFVF